MIPIHVGRFVPKYESGKWRWNNKQEKITFLPKPETEIKTVDVIKTGGFEFKLNLNQLEEMIFRQEFQRSDTTHDADVILIRDIINLVLYLSPKEIMTRSLIQFIHTNMIYRFFNSLIIYFEYFLKVVEYLVIRRDDINCDLGQLQSEESIVVKRIYASHLSQYRLILAREYSTILLGEDEAKPFYHLKPIVNISQSIRDKAFHEAFLAFSTQVVWIAHHRRSYELIDNEMNRLFRSEYFKLSRYETIQFTKIEQDTLYGENYRRVNYRAQVSPLVQELQKISMKNSPILWIGKRKYRGTDNRIYQLELEYVVPDSQLSLIDVTHGILGHPRDCYNTLLQLNWEAVRSFGYCKDFDPYHIMRQPELKIPDLDEEKLRKQCQSYEHYYSIVDFIEPVTKKMQRKWMNRDKVMSYFNDEGMIMNIETKCEKELLNTSYGPSVKEITEKFLITKEKLRKKKVKKTEMV